MKSLLRLRRHLFTPRWCTVSRRSQKRCRHTSQYSISVPCANVAELIMKDFGKLSNKVAIINGKSGETITYGQLEHDVIRYAEYFRQLGIRKEDVVCVCGSNAPEFAHVFLAANGIGAAVTIANGQLTSRELADQLNISRAKFVFATEDTIVKCQEAVEIVDACKGVFPIQNMSSLLPNFNNCAMSNPLRFDATDDDLALVPFSSGTTGLPKGVELTHANLTAQLCQLRHHTVIPLDSGEDRVITMLPMVHIAGLVIGLLNPLAQGATVVILPKFEPLEFLQAVQKYRGTFSLLAPPIVNFLANDPMVDQFDLSSLRDPYSGASTLGKELTEKMVQRLKLDGIRQGYGMSETSPVVMTDPPNNKQYGSIGQPIPATTTKLVDPTSGNDITTPGEEGEIWVKGPQVMRGYIGQPESTRAVITDDDWFKTGDVGYFNQEGSYFVVDRIKDIIKYKGYQIAPAYLEGILMSHPHVKEAAVIGAPVGVNGEVPVAYVITSTPVSEDTLINFVNEQVAPYKRLRGGVVFTQEIPKSPSGKILRRLIRSHN
uniref:4-coumarate--CoA ligase 1-like n=1 Tax=Crassostrea virginica TaxID=6565 RepID=A0A8B8DQ76_CRAVI|nr:4-coumarate--CoA ligase 1-like [Crassostrea virginica]